MKRYLKFWYVYPSGAEVRDGIVLNDILDYPGVLDVIICKINKGCKITLVEYYEDGKCMYSYTPEKKLLGAKATKKQ